MSLYRWVEHTAEVELAIAADSAAGVLADALAALGELLGVGAAGGGPEAAAGGGPEAAAGGVGGGPEAAAERRTVEVRATDRPALLAAWLEELVYLAESEGFVPSELVSCRLEAERLETVVAGYGGNPPPIVKAVTYHRLAFGPAGLGYEATVVLDV